MNKKVQNYNNQYNDDNDDLKQESSNSSKSETYEQKTVNICHEISDPEINTKCETPEEKEYTPKEEDNNNKKSFNDEKYQFVEINDENKNDNSNNLITSKDVYQVIDSIRKNTNLSFDYSYEALRVVLINLKQLFPNNIHSYIDAITLHLNDKIETPKDLLGNTHDAKRLQYIFSQLTDCKNDTEQRSWMLYEDEEDIVQFLEELLDILVCIKMFLCFLSLSL